MGMTASVRIGIAALACGFLSACGDDLSVVPNAESDCVSHYDSVVTATSWDGLQDALLTRSRVVSLRTQARGDDVDGAGNEDVVRVVDLLNDAGRRVVQVDVWRTDAGAWRAGAWSQCID